SAASGGIQRALAADRPVTGRPAGRDEPAFPLDRQPRECGRDHLAPPGDAHRPEAFRKKSRSTTRSPTFAWNCPSCRFQLLISAWCTPCCAIVRSLFKASSATFVLNPTL